MAYNDRTTAAKNVRHPHSKLKTQKELKKITDSKKYKETDYAGKTEMLGGKTSAVTEKKKKKKNFASGGRVGYSDGGQVRPGGGWTS